MHVEITGRLRNRDFTLTHEPNSLDLELSTENSASPFAISGFSVTLKLGVRETSSSSAFKYSSASSTSESDCPAHAE